MKGYTNLQLFFSDRVGLIVTWPGAFMPGSKVSGVSPSFLEDLDRLSGKIREKVDFLGLCVVNDPFVAQSWSRVEIANIDIICDPECILTEHLGVAKVVEPLGLRANKAEAFLLGPEKQVRVRAALTAHSASTSPSSPLRRSTSAYYSGAAGMSRQENHHPLEIIHRC